MRRKKFSIFVDFDGTITTRDSLQLVLDRFAGPDWRNIEEKVTHHVLPERIALAQEFELVKATPEEVENFVVQNVEIDPFFPDFLETCLSKNIRIKIVSGGFEQFIALIWQKYKLPDIPVEANRYLFLNGKWRIIPNSIPTRCGRCNHCKSAQVLRDRHQGFTIIYIGDGNTDRCPAGYANIVFAKKDLAAFLSREGFFFYPFQNFDDISGSLEELWYNWYELTID